MAPFYKRKCKYMENSKDEKNLENRRKALRRYIEKNHMGQVLKGLLSALLTSSSRNVGLVVDDDLQPRTDGNTIWVSLIPALLDKKWEKNWGVLLRPITAHEAQHKNSSNFDHMEEIRTWFSGELKNEGLDENIGTNVASDYLNALEDGRIEQISANRHPGLVVPYQFLNDCIREGCTIEEKADKPEKEFDDFFGQVLSYAKTGLYAPGIEVYAGTEMEENFLAIRGCIDNAVQARDSQACFEWTKAMLSDLLPYLVKLIKNSPELQAKLKEKQAADEYKGAEETQFNTGTEQRNSLRANSPTFGNVGVGGGSDESGMTEEQGTNYGFSNALPSQKGYSDQDIQDMEAAFQRSISLAKKQEQPSKDEGKGGLDEEEIKQLINAVYGGGVSNFCEEWRKYPEVAIPPDVRMEANRLRKELTKFLQMSRSTSMGHKSGLLDIKSLWKVGAGEKNIFYRPGRKDIGSCAFYMLIDNSGSMHEMVYQGVSKSFAARRAAAIIEEASRGLVPMKVALFEQSGKARHISLKSFDSKSHINACYSSLSTISPSGCNADSVHIRVAAKELSNRRERKKILFILSDGLPSAYGSKQNGIAEVRAAVDDATRKGIIVIPIIFGAEEFRKNKLGDFQQMYPKNIISCDPKDISMRLPYLFQRIIVQS